MAKRAKAARNAAAKVSVAKVEEIKAPEVKATEEKVAETKAAEENFRYIDNNGNVQNLSVDSLDYLLKDDNTYNLFLY